MEFRTDDCGYATFIPTTSEFLSLLQMIKLLLEHYGFLRSTFPDEISALILEYAGLVKFGHRSMCFWLIYD